MKIYLTVLLIICFLTNFAQDSISSHPLISSKFIFNVGVFSSAKTARLGVNASGSNEVINFNESLNFRDHQTTFFFNFNWRFSKKGSLSTEFYSIQNNYEQVLAEDIEWEDILFKEGSIVEIDVGADMYRIFVGRTFSKGLKHEFGIGIGLYTMNFNTSIKGDAYTNEGDYKIEHRSVSFLAPLPNIGFWYFYAPNAKWGFIGRLEWFSISISDYAGSLWNIGPGINYQLLKRVGVGMSYRYFSLITKVDKSDWDGKVKFNFKGPLFSLSANF